MLSGYPPCSAACKRRRTITFEVIQVYLQSFQQVKRSTASAAARHLPPCYVSHVIKSQDESFEVAEFIGYAIDMLSRQPLSWKSAGVTSLYNTLPYGGVRLVRITSVISSFLPKNQKERNGQRASGYTLMLTHHTQLTRSLTHSCSLTHSLTQLIYVHSTHSLTQLTQLTQNVR